MSFVFSVSAASTRSAVVISVSVSMSTHTGVAPASAIMFGVDAHVIDGVMTSSPCPIPSARSSTCSPAVADVSATACRAPVYAANARSTRALCAGRDPARFEHRVTASMSCGVIDGRENGKNG